MLLKIIDDTRVNKDREYISFSEIHSFDQCPWKHHDTYNLKNRDEGTFYTFYGTAIHEAIEQKWKFKNDLAWLKMSKIIYLAAKLDPDSDGKYKGKTSKEWVESALKIYKEFFPWIEKNFPDCELYDIEYPLEEKISTSHKYFKGYIDLILYNRKLDIYHIIDLKTASWGWNSKQLSDTKKLYQVILYKHFFSQKENIPKEKIFCHYLLLLRTPSPKDSPSVSLISVTSGERKIQNSLNWMNKTLELISRGIKLKTPSTCSFCNCGAKKNRY